MAAKILVKYSLNKLNVNNSQRKHKLLQAYLKSDILLISKVLKISYLNMLYYKICDYIYAYLYIIPNTTINLR